MVKQARRLRGGTDAAERAAAKFEECRKEECGGSGWSCCGAERACWSLGGFTRWCDTSESGSLRSERKTRNGRRVRVGRWHGAGGGEVVAQVLLHARQLVRSTPSTHIGPVSG
jgi:hypothetical protein